MSNAPHIFERRDSLTCGTDPARECSFSASFLIFSTPRGSFPLRSSPSYKRKKTEREKE